MFSKILLLYVIGKYEFAAIILFVYENAMRSIGRYTTIVFAVIPDNYDIMLYGLFNPKGIVIRKKGITQSNTAILLGIRFISLMSIMIIPVRAAVKLILNIQ